MGYVIGLAAKRPLHDAAYDSDLARSVPSDWQTRKQRIAIGSVTRSIETIPA